MAVIEFARNVLGWTAAQSTEFDKDTKYPVVNGEKIEISRFSIYTHSPSNP